MTGRLVGTLLRRSVVNEAEDQRVRISFADIRSSRQTRGVMSGGLHRLLQLGLVRK